MMRLHVASRSIESDRAHLMLVVELHGAQYIVDVALGSLSMTAPVLLDVDAGEQLTSDGPRRVTYLSNQRKGLSKRK